MAANGGPANLRPLIASTATVLMLSAGLWYQFGNHAPSSSAGSDASKAADTTLASADNFQRMEAEAGKNQVIGDDLATRMIKKHSEDASPPSGDVAAPANTPSPPEASPAPATQEPTAPSHQAVVCTAEDRVMNRPWCNSGLARAPSGSGSPVAQDNSRGPAAVVPSKNPLLIAKDLSRDEVEVLKGRSTVYNDRVIRAGCRVLAVFEDAMRITPDIEHSFTVNVRGALDGCTLPNVDGIRLVGKAKMNKNGRYFTADIETCSDRSPTRKSVKCKAKVKSITGEDLLEGDLYDETGWGIFLEGMISIGMTPAIAKLTETAASARTIFQANAAASISDTLLKALSKVSEKISGMFDNKEIRTKENIIVIVMFPDDVIL